MKYPIPGFSSPSVGLDAPLEMLAACHQRVDSRCQTLQRLSVHLGKNGANEEAQSAAKNILQYFNSAAKHHHEDEEIDLFPVIIKAMEREEFAQERKEILSTIEKLLADHRLLESIWSEIRPTLEQIAQRKFHPLDASLIAKMSSTYEAHILLEEKVIFPIAKRIFDQEMLLNLSSHMTQRRTMTS